MHFFFWLAWSVRTSLHAPRLFPTPHWTSCKPSEQVRHRGGDRRAHRGSNWGGTSHTMTAELNPQGPSNAFLTRLVVLLSAHLAVNIPLDGALGVQYLVLVWEHRVSRVSFCYFFLFSNRFDVLISKIFF